MSFSELIITLLVAFVVLGPKRLVDAAYRCGNFVGYLRQLRDKAKGQWDQQIKLIELQKNCERALLAEKEEASLKQPSNNNSKQS